LRAEDVGPHKRSGVLNTAIDVALRREVDDSLHTLPELGDRSPDGLTLGDVAPDELVAGMACQVGQIGQVAGVGEGVEVDDRDIPFGFQDVTDEIAADEAAAAGDKEGSHEFPNENLMERVVARETRAERVAGTDRTGLAHSPRPTGPTARER